MTFEITQVVQEFSTDGGTETVAWELQRAWGKMGVPSVVFASVVDGDGAGAPIRPVAPWLARMPTRGMLRHAGRLIVVPGFTLAATLAVRARRKTVVLSHGDCLSGDVLVVHAVNKVNLLEKQRAGKYSWMLNPMHLWVAARDRWMIGGLRYRIIVAVSNRVKQELMEHYHVPSGRIRIIPNGIALDRFVADPAGGRAIRTAFGIPADGRLLLFVGHEFSRKGLAHAAGALPLLDANTWLLVVGANDPEPYRRLAGAAASRMIFAGPRRDMPALYSAADAFLFPTAYESFSLVCMEAMACGVPIFATAVGGIEDYIRDDFNGMTIPQDATGIAKIVGPILADDAKLAKLAQGALSTAEHYGWDAVAARYRDMLLEVWTEKVRPDYAEAV